MKTPIYVRLKEIRTEQNLTQSQFGKLLNVSQDTVSLWEKGKSGERKGKAQAGWWLLLCAVNVTAAMATTMGAFLLALFTAVCGLVLAVRQRRPGYLFPLAAACVPGLAYLAIYAAVVFL